MNARTGWIDSLEPAAASALPVMVLLLAGFLVFLGARFYLRQRRHFQALDRIEIEHANSLDRLERSVTSLQQSVASLQQGAVSTVGIEITADTSELERALELLGKYRRPL